MRDVARTAALVVALLVLARSVAVGAGSAALLTATGIVVVVVAAAVALLRDGLVTGAGVALAAHYALALGYGDVEIDLAAPVVGALVVLFLDLGDLAASLPSDRRVDRAFALASLRHAALVLGVGVAAGAAVFVVAALPWPGAEWLRAAGALGVAAAVAVPLLLLRRRPET